MYKISVVIPIYKVEEYIEKCCRSLFGQTLDDIEYVFVDDCSPDRSIDVLLKILNEFPDRIKDVKILRNKVNMGVSQTRRKGIGATTGEYVIHCDPDDWLEVTAYEKLYFYAKTKELDIVSCDYFKVDEFGLINKNQSPPLNGDILKMLLISKMQGALWNRLVKSSIVKKTDIIYPLNDMAEDLVLVLQYYIIASTYGHLLEPLYYYNTNPKSISYFENIDKLLNQANDMSQNKQLIASIFKRVNLHQKYSKEIIANKFFDKRWILPAIVSAKKCSLWMKIHPDINVSLYTCPYLSIKDLLTSFLVELRLYPLLRKVIRRR